MLSETKLNENCQINTNFKTLSLLSDNFQILKSLCQSFYMFDLSLRFIDTQTTITFKHLHKSTQDTTPKIIIGCILVIDS
jgi:hypothetical protein